MAVDHDVVIKSPFRPAVKFNINTPSNPNLGSFYDSNTCVRIKYSAIYPTSATIQVMEIGAELEDKLQSRIFFFNNTDEDGDRNHRFDWMQASLL